MKLARMAIGLALVLTSCAETEAEAPEVGPAVTIRGVVCTPSEQATKETDRAVNVTFEPPASDQEPGIDAEAACRVAMGQGGAGSTSAEASFGLLKWPEFMGGVERLPVWRVIFDEACVPAPGGSPPPGAPPMPKPRGCAVNQREAVLVDATTGEHLATYASEDLG